MTTKRYLVVAGIMVALLCAGLLISALIPPAPGVTKANFDRIENGMTLAEVETVFGRGPDIEFAKEFHRGLIIDSYEWGDVWGDTNEGAASVSFRDNVVTEKSWREPTETIIQKLRRWIRL